MIVYGFLLKDKKSLKPICCTLYLDSIEVISSDWSFASTRNDTIKTTQLRADVQINRSQRADK